MCIILHIYTHQIANIMRTNIEIDDDLMANVLKVTGLKTKKEAVEQGLLSLIRLKKQQSIRGLRGKLNWDADLDKLRSR
jgi:Arc/MetJ family transcription regulator